MGAAVRGCEGVRRIYGSLGECARRWAKGRVELRRSRGCDQARLVAEADVGQAHAQDGQWSSGRRSDGRDEIAEGVGARFYFLSEEAAVIVPSD